MFPLKEYLNQTFNFMPELKVQYMNKTRSTYYEVAQAWIPYTSLTVLNSDLDFLLTYIYTGGPIRLCYRCC